MLKEMPLDIFMYWVTYLSLSKTKHSKQDYQMALLTKATVEQNSKSTRPITDYLIKFETEEQAKKRQEEQDLAFMRRLASYPGARVVPIKDNDQLPEE